MRAGSDENNLIVCTKLVDKEEIATDMAFPEIRPLSTKRMIVVLGGKRSIVGDDQQHRRFEAAEIEAA